MPVLGCELGFELARLLATSQMPTAAKAAIISTGTATLLQDQDFWGTNFRMDFFLVLVFLALRFMLVKLKRF
jgi:hypothetical protein